MREEAVTITPERTNEDRYLDYFPRINRALHFLYNRTTEGKENIPDEPAFFVANHLSSADPLLITAEYTEHTGRPLRAVAQQEYFDGKGLRIPVGPLTKLLHREVRIGGRVIQSFMQDTWMIPTNREVSRESMAALQTQLAATFERGESVVGYAEATRSPDGRLYRLREALIRLIIVNEVIAVPSAHVYGGVPLPLMKKSLVKFDRPITPEDYHSGDFAGLALGPKVKLLTDTIEGRIAALSGQERAGVYAPIPGVAVRSHEAVKP